MENKKIIIFYFLLKISITLSCQNLIKNSSFEELIKKSEDDVYFRYWTNIDNKVFKKTIVNHYQAPPFFAKNYNVNDFINIYTNRDNDAKNNFFYLRNNSDLYLGTFQFFKKNIKKRYFFFSIKVKQLNDTQNCSNCNIPLQVMFSKGFVSPYASDKEIQKNKIINIPLHSNSSKANPWIKYSFIIELEKGINCISLCNFEYNEKNINQKLFINQLSDVRQIDSDFYVDDVVLYPILNKDTFFHPIEKRSLKKVTYHNIELNKEFYFDDCKCFGIGNASALGTKALGKLDSLAYILNEMKLLCLDVILPLEKDENTENVASQIKQYLEYHVGGKRIFVKFTNKSNVKLVKNDGNDKNCPRAFWSSPLDDLYLQKIDVGFIFHNCE